MTKNQWAGVAVALVVVGTGGFFAGKSQAAPAAAKGFNGSFNTAGAGGFVGRGGRGAGGATIGKIVSAGNGSISIQMQNSSSSEIVLLGSNTQILKTVSGSASDLTVGDTVTVQGTPNSDGSLSAAMISIVPAGAIMRFGGAQSGAPQPQATQ